MMCQVLCVPGCTGAEFVCACVVRWVLVVVSIELSYEKDDSSLSKSVQVGLMDATEKIKLRSGINIITKKLRQKKK